MNCDETRALFDDYAAGALPDAASRAIETHLRNCPGCRAVATEELRLRAALRALPVPKPRAGFAQQALRRARARNRLAGLPPASRWFGTGFATAMLAMVLVWGGLMSLGPQTPVAAKLHMAVNQVRTVGLLIDAPEDLAGVEVSMKVPEHVELVGFPGRRNLSWKTDLRKGRNVLSLPILATMQGEDDMHVSLFHERKTKTFRVELGVAGAEQSRRSPGTVMPG